MFTKGGLGNLMKQAQQMQEKMAKIQEEIAKMEVTGEAGAGLVKVTINGAHNCRRVEVDRSIMMDIEGLLEPYKTPGNLFFIRNCLLKLLPFLSLISALTINIICSL